MHQWLAGWLGN